MGVNVGAASIGAFIALIVAVALAIGTIVARRRGALQNRTSIIAIAIIIGLLLIYGMGFGVMRPW